MAKVPDDITTILDDAKIIFGITPEQNDKVPLVVGVGQAGIKFDENKLRFDLVPPEALQEIISVLNYGATKYAARNWENGIKYGRIFAALMRHMWTWWSGEEKDQESGLSHLAHAGCCIFFLIAHTKRQHLLQYDDRPTRKALE